MPEFPPLADSSTVFGARLQCRSTRRMINPAEILWERFIVHCERAKNTNSWPINLYGKYNTIITAILSRCVGFFFGGRESWWNKRFRTKKGYRIHKCMQYMTIINRFESSCQVCKPFPRARARERRQKKNFACKTPVTSANVCSALMRSD